jgi:hypothetical protein
MDHGFYFNEGTPGSWRIAQVSVNGGQTASITTRLINPQIVGLAADASALLALVRGFGDPLHPLWSIPLPAGEPRRVGDMEVHDASLFRDGRILFTQPTGLFVAERDGSSPRKLANNSNLYAAAPSVSPDGKRVCFTTWSGMGSTSRLLEIGVDDSAHHEVLSPGSELSSPGFGKWTPTKNIFCFRT